MLDVIDRATYDRQTGDIGGKHWRNAEARWAYHAAAAEIACSLELTSPQDVLEVGTMGVQIVPGSDTMDYNATNDWLIQGYEPTMRNDARSLPWPIEDKAYRLFIALRVFHHLAPKQHKCFLEATRIADNIIIVVPGSNIHKHGIDEQHFIDWYGGIAPKKVVEFPGTIGRLFFWKTAHERW